MENIIPIGVVNTNRMTPNAGGYVITWEQLNRFQEQAETMCCAKLRKYYVYPLETVKGDKDFNNFDVLPKGVLSNYFVANTCIVISNFAMSTAGAQSKAKMLKSGYEEMKANAEEILFALDKASGQIYPAFDELKYSDMYIPRQHNPYPQSKAPSTRYSSAIDFSANIGNAGWKY